MKILMVSPYPPIRDGIASYAQQQVRALRAEGHDVEVLSPGPSAAHHHLDLLGPRGGLALAKRVRAYDKVIVQFHPDFFFPLAGTPRTRAMVAGAYATAFAAAHSSEIVVHEVDYAWGKGPASLAVRGMFAALDSVVVHTDTERTRVMDSFGVPAGKVHLSEHGADFARNTRRTRASARASLGLGPEEKVLVSLGFIQPHKGFHRGIAAFRGLGSAGASYHVVGSLRVEEPAYAAYLERLEELSAKTPGTHVHTGYVSDELFDRWIVAADAIVLPYEHIWSSGVMERAALYGRPVIATRVGGLMEQAAGRDGLTIVDGDEGLREAMRAVVLGSPGEAGVGEAGPAATWPSDEQDLRAALQREVVSRATQRRGMPLEKIVEPGAVAVASQASAPLRNETHSIILPPAQGHNPGNRLAKRVVRKLTAWQLDPVLHEVNKLREAAITSVERAAVYEAVEPRSEQDGQRGTTE
ncbi:MAG: glycosyltransferase family 4 protein [Actinomycetales bacterium]